MRKDDFGKEKSVPTAGNVETSQKQTIVKKTIVETTVQEETTRAIDPNKPMIALTLMMVRTIYRKATGCVREV